MTRIPKKQLDSTLQVQPTEGAFVDGDKTSLDLNTTHRTSNGTDHTYINQDVTTTASPTFAGAALDGDLDFSNTDTLAKEINLQSARPTDDILGGTDGTSRINLYAYQRANYNSFGENIRHYMMYKDAKSMDTWYFPDGGYDGSREPVGSMKPVVWTGAHWEANDHASNHKHWSVETPDSTGAIQTRFEVRWGDPAVDNAISGLDKTLIATNLADFVVRTSNSQVLRLSSPAGNHKPIEFNHDYAGSTGYRRWILRANSTAESGSNVGTDFQLVRYDDSGNFVDSPIFVKRSNAYIGLGSTTPTSRLHLGNYAADEKIVIAGQNGSTTGASLEFRESTSGSGNGVNIVYNSSANVLNFVNGNTGSTINSLDRDTGSFYPGTDSAQTLGTSSLYWSNTYTDRLYVNSTAYIDGGTAGVATLTGRLDLSNAGHIDPNSSTRMDVGFYSNTGAGFEIYKFSDGTRPGEFRTLYGGGASQGKVDFIHYDGVSTFTTTLSMDHTGKLTTPLAQTYSESNVTTDRTYDANATTLDEVADVLGTLIADLRAIGLVN